MQEKTPSQTPSRKDTQHKTIISRATSNSNVTYAQTSSNQRISRLPWDKNTTGNTLASVGSRFSHQWSNLFRAGTTNFTEFTRFSIDDSAEDEGEFVHVRSSAQYSAISAGFGVWLQTGAKEWNPKWSRRRMVCAWSIESRGFKLLITVCILLSVWLVVSETDHRASDVPMPLWQVVAHYTLVGIYTIEILLRIYAHRMRFFNRSGNWFDFLLISAELCVECMKATGIDAPSLSFVRIFRLGRVLRVLRVLLMFRELSMMVHGIASALRAIFWATAMIFLVLLVWSIISVEFLNDLIHQMREEDGTFEDCSRCMRAFSSVEMAMLTFIKTILAGDSWGELAVPIIEKEPITMLIFMSAFISVQLGLMNLVLAVIVDRAQEARQEDIQLVLSERAERFKKEKIHLYRLCESLDEDNSGRISKEELIQGFESNGEFADLLRYINISKQELSMFFQSLDVDNSGSVSYKEFVEQLYMMKTQETRTVMLYNLYMNRNTFSEGIRDAQEKLLAQFEKQGRQLNKVVDKLTLHDRYLHEMRWMLESLSPEATARYNSPRNRSKISSRIGVNSDSLGKAVMLCLDPQEDPSNRESQKFSACSSTIAGSIEPVPFINMAEDSTDCSKFSVAKSPETLGSVEVLSQMRSLEQELQGQLQRIRQQCNDSLLSAAVGIVQSFNSHRDTMQALSRSDNSQKNEFSLAHTTTGAMGNGLPMSRRTSEVSSCSSTPMSRMTSPYVGKKFPNTKKVEYTLAGLARI